MSKEPWHDDHCDDRQGGSDASDQPHPPNLLPEIIGPKKRSDPHENGRQEGDPLPENGGAGGHARLNALALGQIGQSGDLPYFAGHVAPQVSHHEHADGRPNGQPGAPKISYESAPQRGRPQIAHNEKRTR